MLPRTVVTLFTLLFALATSILSISVPHDFAAVTGGDNRSRKRRSLSRRNDDCEGEIAAGCEEIKQVKVVNDETFEHALKRFKKKCQTAGIMAEMRRRCFYEKPSVRRKKSVPK